MTRPLARWQAALLGLALLLGLAASAYALVRIGDRQQLWHGTATIRADFPHLGGVGVGTPVRVRGVEAGSVRAVELPAADTPAAAIRVQLQLDRRFLPLLGADAVAVVGSEGMVGGKVVEIEPGHPERGPLADGATIATRAAPDLNQLVAETRDALAALRDGHGTLGKLMKDGRAYDDLVGTLAQAKATLADGQSAVKSLQRDADAVQRLPVIRSYAPADPVALLVRPRMTRHREVLPADELFEPCRAVLTDAGKAKLETVGAWLLDHRESGSEVVVVGYDSTADARLADVLSGERAEAVGQHLRSEHAAAKRGRWPWQTRTLTCLGRGRGDPLEPEPTPLPPARVEVIVFVP